MALPDQNPPPAGVAPGPAPWFPRLRWIGAALAALGLYFLYSDALRAGFMNDDYLFLEQARSGSLLESLGRAGAIGNYYRPLSRQIYFAALAPLAGGRPEVFHAANLLLFLVGLALLFDLLRALMPLRGAVAGTLYFALLPLQRVNLIWVSCSQDLLALVLTLAACALFRREHTRWALLAALGAFASKEIALALPVALLGWCVLVDRRRPREALSRTLPFFALAVAWGALSLGVALAAPEARQMRFDPAHFLAALVHEAQSLLGIEHPSGLWGALASRGPALLPLALISAAVLLLPARGDEPRRSGSAVTFALLWLLAFGLLTGPVVRNWSAYYYTVPAVGAALLVGLLFRRRDRLEMVALVTALLWLHAGVSATRAFAVGESPWSWTSHLPASFFQRASGLTSLLGRQLQAIEPTPPHGARLFFATLPPWAGFQRGNGALVRTLYRDPSLESHFFSQFSESTAAEAPCRFFYWDGAELKPLYRNLPDPLFQVGADLLLLDRPARAAHAFRRALASGGEKRDNLYWLGWAELWNGRRDAAEAAWKAMGAVDDSNAWKANMFAARLALVTLRDTLEGRRTLAEAIRYGIGRPEAHGVLGGILLPRQPKYGMLELKVATTLNPDDWLSRRALLGALLDARLEEPARRQLEALLSRRRELGADPVVMRARRALGAPSEETARVVEF